VFAHLVADGEPETFVVGYGGCVGMMGMNEHGVAVAANNLKPTDAVAGVPWTFICRSILACETADAAAAELARARLCSGHHFLIGDASGGAISIETSGRSYAVMPIADAVYAHTNHYLDPDLKKVEKGSDPKGCSPHRLERMNASLGDGRGRIDSAFIQDALRDHDGKPRSICSHDYEVSSGTKVRSCGAVVMNTVKQEIDYVSGNPCQGEFSTFRF
jgi:isopenicillin-N N-acyltransferase-like protein